MQFRILGPVEVWLDSRLTVPSAQQRALLAALLLGANRVQETTWLIEAMWGDTPPPMAADHLTSQVNELRRLLGRRIESVDDNGRGPGQPRGYLVRIEPMQLDLALFEETAKRARIDLASRDYAAAATGLRAALALWRGSPLSDVDSTLLREFEAPRLEEQRLSAVEDRIEADLRLGRHAEVVKELHVLTVEHPLRERFCRHLMIALYRCRHRDAALRAYAAAERAMRALGVNPGAGLRQLALAVRTDHPSLGPPDPRR